MKLCLYSQELNGFYLSHTGNSEVIYLSLVVFIDTLRTQIMNTGSNVAAGVGLGEYNLLAVEVINIMFIGSQCVFGESLVDHLLGCMLEPSGNFFGTVLPLPRISEPSVKTCQCEIAERKVNS